MVQAASERMNVARYLKRIDYSGPRSPTVDVLRRLHRKHMLSVPFENLDIYLDKPIVLDQQGFYHKIVDNRRGGYCYELNGCFAWLLNRLGFRVSMLSARVATKQGDFSPEFDHMTLLVQLRERWLADVGFGDSFTEPKRVDTDEPQEDEGYLYRFTYDGKEWLVSRRPDDSAPWKAQYTFTIRPHQLQDFDARNRYQQTSPHSHFTRGRLISKLTSSGRVTMTDKNVVVTRKGTRIERAIKNEVEFAKLLQKHFHIRLPSGHAGSGQRRRS